MKVKRIWGIVTCVLLIVMIVCTMPFPQRVDVTLSCAEATLDGVIKEEVTFCIEGWYLKYLLRPDELKASVRIEKADSAVTSMKIDGPVSGVRVTENWCSAPVYDANSNGYGPVVLGFSDAMDVFVLTYYGSETFYAAASDIRENLPQILERFNFVIH